MNMMFVYEDRRIVTPVLNGSILPGITRDSVLKLGKHLGYETEEARMDIHDVIADIKAGRVTEAFGTGHRRGGFSREQDPLPGRGDRHRRRAASAISPSSCTTCSRASSSARRKIPWAGLSI